MNTEESDVIRKLRDQYRWIRNNSVRLLNACPKNPSLKARIDDALQESLKNYVIAEHLIPDKSTEKVKQLGEVAEKSQEEIKRAVEESKTIRKSLEAITQAIAMVGITIGSL